MLITMLNVNDHPSSMSVTKHHVNYSVFNPWYKFGTILSQEYRL